MSPSVGVGIGVFVFRSRTDRRFVFGKRVGSLGSGSYALTGGHLEHGETFEQCARREVLEETGLEIQDVTFLSSIENFYREEGKHYVTMFMAAYVKDDFEGGSGKEAKAQVSFDSALI